MGKKHSSGVLIGTWIVTGALLGAIGGSYAVSSARGRKADKELKHFGKKAGKKLIEYSDYNRNYK